MYYLIVGLLLVSGLLYGCQKEQSPIPKPHSATQPTPSAKPQPASASQPVVATQPTSGPSYEIAYVPDAAITIDGKLDEKAWEKAGVITDFHLPFEDRPAPPMEFRGLCDDANFYFVFKVYDKDFVAADEIKDKTGVDEEDRPEIFFASDEKSDIHYGLEIDSKGRIHDFSWTFSKHLIDNTWSCPGAKAAGATFDKGYIVEGLIPLATFKSLGMQPLLESGTMKVGVFRGCYTRVGGKIETHWMSWVDLRKPKFGFHNMAFFGTFHGPKDSERH